MIRSILVAESFMQSTINLVEDNSWSQYSNSTPTINSATWEPLEKLYSGEVIVSRLIVKWTKV